MTNSWEKFYKKANPEKVPWNRTPYDYLLDLVKNKRIGKGTALDLGCGIGTQSILLSKNGFEVTGIDISSEAIKQAKQNAKKSNSNIKFFTKDATNLSFLGNKKFDLVLDWGNLHGIPSTKTQKYVKEIANHTKSGSLLILRCFNKAEVSPNVLGFITVMGTVMIYSDEDIKKLYSKYFKILEAKQTIAKHRLSSFSEYLMQRI